MAGRHAGRFAFAAVALGLAVLITSSCAPQGPPLEELTEQKITDLRVRAEQGDAGAQHDLGFMYWYGLGVTQDEVEAVGWYRRAADQGSVEAQLNLGFAHAVGLGVT
ncbi:MAG: hypothetical protein CL489_08160, partial [Acidobacteria bacterium]|nr:hypothetical protein [Acidobacteriota bacterium]